jgi:SAM-dependent methyltransferase
MRNGAVELEESRLRGIEKLEDYPWFMERHRVFPTIFEDRHHKKILDSSAGVGCTAKRIKDNYPAELVCNDISPTCLKLLHSLGVPTFSFDIDENNTFFPFEDGHFDALISLVTLEHLLNPDHFLKESNRILCENGFLYISTPNYAALYYVLRLALTGKSFHDPITEAYEFNAHIKYFTYRTMIELVSSKGFVLDTVYLALPEGGYRYKELLLKSRAKAIGHRYGRWLMYHLLPIRWSAEPILCFQKSSSKQSRKVRKVVL